MVGHVMREAASAIRPYLVELVGANAAGVDHDLSSLLSEEPEPADVDDRLLSVLRRDPATYEWILEFLEDPAGVPPDLQSVRSSGTPIGGPVPASRYRCPRADHYVWYMRNNTEPVRTCPDHGCLLVTP